MNRYRSFTLPVFRWRCAPSSRCYKRFSSSTTATPEELSHSPNRKEQLFWQLKVASYVSGIAISIYGTYVFVSSGFQLDRSKRKVLLHFYGMLYGNTLPKRVQALLNSRYSACLDQDVLRYLSAYFIKFDLIKDNGFTRRDAVLFLENIGIDATNPFVAQFIAAASGDSMERRMVSGCSLQEFAELIEALVLEEKINGRSDLENRLKGELKQLVEEEELQILHHNPFRLNNPLISGLTNALSKELRKYVHVDIEAARTKDLQNELNRRHRSLHQLQRIAKSRQLSDAEIRRLHDIEEELELLQKELSKEAHVCNILSSM
ncbi:hypothetical protein BaOVIS_028510 [Babesia ovis]|uniref:Uncharacterized protein n=1 Tax=Babesia ovis TaxID=5869 RepID=A0A9W5TC30_BABOV|nr:hypothetical protein BaOVIS_028510 [Babesia ovis]